MTNCVFGQLLLKTLHKLGFKNSDRAVDAIAITQIPKLNLAVQSFSETTTVPESTSILGLLALGMIGVMGIVKQQHDIDC